MKTIMLIHGAWLTTKSWDRFRSHYEAKGYTVVAPAWPYLDASVVALQTVPPPDLAKLGIRQIVDHYDTLIRKLPEPPILIGHSFGGLFVQLLLDRGLGAAGVAIAPAPLFGVLASPRAVWTSIKVFTTWNAWNRVLRMSFDDFASGLAQTLPEAEKKPAYDMQVIPTPGRNFFEAQFGIGGRVNWANPARPPLLLIAGSKDRTITPSMVKTNFKKQRRASSATEFREFQGRSHWLCNEKGWEEIADLALSWAAEHGGR
jgi:pimeloyl-ACP methyl ester carboxylesterase